jgi:hypothetical protein
MVIKMLLPTFYGGRRLNAGDEITVDVKTASRWVKNGIAEEIDTGAAEKKPARKKQSP